MSFVLVIKSQSFQKSSVHFLGISKPSIFKCKLWAKLVSAADNIVIPLTKRPFSTDWSLGVILVKKRLLVGKKCSNIEIASNVGSGTNKFLEELKANERENFRMVGEKVRTMSHVFPINNQENESCTSCQVIKAVSHDAMSEPAALPSENKLKRSPLDRNWFASC